MAREFASEWGHLIPEPGTLMEITCVRCGSSHAAMDRVGNQVYGSHDRPAGCGWAAILHIVASTKPGKVALIPRPAE